MSLTTSSACVAPKHLLVVASCMMTACCAFGHPASSSDACMHDWGIRNWGGALELSCMNESDHQQHLYHTKAFVGAGITLYDRALCFGHPVSSSVTMACKNCAPETGLVLLL